MVGILPWPADGYAGWIKELRVRGWRFDLALFFRRGITVPFILSEGWDVEIVNFGQYCHECTFIGLISRCTYHIPKGIAI